MKAFKISSIILLVTNTASASDCKQKLPRLIDSLLLEKQPVIYKAYEKPKIANPARQAYEKNKNIDDLTNSLLKKEPLPPPTESDPAKLAARKAREALERNPRYIPYEDRANALALVKDYIDSSDGVVYSHLQLIRRGKIGNDLDQKNFSEKAWKMIQHFLSNGTSKRSSILSIKTNRLSQVADKITLQNAPDIFAELLLIKRGQVKKELVQSEFTEKAWKMVQDFLAK